MKKKKLLASLELPRQFELCEVEEEKNLKKYLMGNSPEKKSCTKINNFNEFKNWNPKIACKIYKI